MPTPSPPGLLSRDVPTLVQVENVLAERVRYLEQFERCLDVARTDVEKAMVKDDIFKALEIHRRLEREYDSIISFGHPLFRDIGAHLAGFERERVEFLSKIGCNYGDSWFTSPVCRIDTLIDGVVGFRAILQTAVLKLRQQRVRLEKQVGGFTSSRRDRAVNQDLRVPPTEVLKLWRLRGSRPEAPWRRLALELTGHDATKALALERLSRKYRRR